MVKNKARSNKANISLKELKAYQNIKTKYIQSLSYFMLFLFIGAIYITLSISLSFRIINPAFYQSLLFMPKEKLAIIVYYVICIIPYILLALGLYAVWLAGEWLERFNSFKNRLDKMAKKIKTKEV